MRRRVVIMGAAGKDFHVFNTCYRDRADHEVVAFTATQIPHIEERTYPAMLAGALYPRGIPIKAESQLASIIRSHRVDEVVFAYSDVSYAYIEERAQLVRAAGAVLKPFDVEATMLPSTRPVIAVCAVRTGAGKSQTTRHVLRILKAAAVKAVAVRHPMPYGDLAKQIVQRFASVQDLNDQDCTIEEMEEYEPIVSAGFVVYAGVDYEQILRRAEREADVIVWDGGNNDTPFYRPDLWICVADPLRPGHEVSYFPGKVNFERCDVVVLNKLDQAKTGDVAIVLDNLKRMNPRASVVRAESVIKVDRAEQIQGKRVLVIEDGPTLTHGGMTFGAGVVAAQRCHAATIVDPRPYAVGEIKETFARYPGTGALLPAMGYGAQQMRDLEATIASVPCDLVLVATPIDLGRIISIRQQTLRVRYELNEIGGASLRTLIEDAIKRPVAK